jgi:calcineurin-like phosphoesterase family protein
VKCRLCGREAVSNLCKYHEKAKRKVEVGYHSWVEAYGEMEWKDYLHKVKHNERTGQWAKEIAEMLEGLQDD